MRTIKELLQLMLDNVDVIKDREKGLCYVINYLFGNQIINSNEQDILDVYINDNKPWYKTLHIFWWKPGDIAPRKRWLEKHIKKQSKQ